MPNSASIAVRPCPECGHIAPRHLVEASKGAVVNYYRCDDCRHVFAFPIDKPGGPSIAVTPRKTDDATG